MSDTAEHRAEAFKAAQKLRKAGKPTWTFTVRFAPTFHDESLPFEERRDQLVSILRRSSWFRSHEWCGGFDRLADIADGLADAENTEEFDGWWDELYDEADYDRAWLITLVTWIRKQRSPRRKRLGLLCAPGATGGGRGSGRCSASGGDPGRPLAATSETAGQESNLTSRFPPGTCIFVSTRDLFASSNHA